MESRARSCDHRLLERGLVLEFLHEMPYCATGIVPMLKVRSDGYYEIPGTDAFPLSFSLLATAPALMALEKTALRSIGGFGFTSALDR